MSLNETMVEMAIQEKGLTAPRLTPEAIDAAIVGEDYHVFPGTTTTVCCLRLKNGFTSVGTSASVSMENFDQRIGRMVARDDARRRVWALEGYLLKEKLYSGQAA